MTANAVVPGGIITPLQRHLPREEMIAMGWMDEAGNIAQGFKTPEQGASTSVWAALGSELEWSAEPWRAGGTQSGTPDRTRTCAFGSGGRHSIR